MNTEEHFSAGGIVIRSSGEDIEVLLCGREAPVVWALPKGTPDPGETVEQTAMREVHEETGLEVRLGNRAGEIEYWFSKADARVHKRVTFFLMSPIGGSIEEHDPEFDRVRWFPSDEALRVMTYPTERKLLRSALRQVRGACKAE